MKTLIAAAMLLALASSAHAETCTGRVKIDTVASDGGLYPKGAKVFNVGACTFGDPALQQRVLRTCPIGSHCRVEGSISGDADIETITSVAKIAFDCTPWRGHEDEALCLKSGPKAVFKSHEAEINKTAGLHRWLRKCNKMMRQDGTLPRGC